jgi:ribosome recycling factor
VKVQGGQTLVIEAFEKSTIADIERAIMSSDLNLHPQNDGSTIRILVPSLTEERRKELCKQVKVMAEDGKVAIRNVRRDVVDKIKAAEKEKRIGKDDCKGFQV